MNSLLTRLVSMLALSSLAGCAATSQAAPSTRFVSPNPVAVDAAPKRSTDRPSTAIEAVPSALPAGWFVPQDLVKLPAPARPGSFRARVAELAKERRVEPIVFDLSKVPVTAIEPHPNLPTEVKELPEGEKATDILTVDYRVVARGRRFGKVVVDWDVRPFFARAEGGASPHTSHGVKRVEYQAFSVLPDGSGELEEMEGYYDIDTKTAVALRRLKAKAIPLAGGLAYAYRTSCARCTKNADVLHLVMPESGWSAPFSETEFDLSVESGGSFLATFSPGALATWRKSGANPPFSRNVRLGVEVTRDSANAAPMAFVYVGEVTL